MAAPCRAGIGLRQIQADPPEVSRACDPDCHLFTRDGNRVDTPGILEPGSHSEKRVVAGVGTTRGFIDDAGQWAIVPRFGEADAFCDGLAPAREPDRPAWGFIDHAGAYAIKPLFEIAGPFTEELAPVRVQGKWGYIDRKGVFMIPPRFDDAALFSEGLAAVRVGDRWGFVDQHGAMVVAVRYDAAGSFHGGVALVTQRGATSRKLFGGLDMAGYRGVIDRSGRMVVSAGYESIARVSDVIIAAGALIRFDPDTTRSLERISLFRTDGSRLTTETYDSVEPLNDGLIPVCRRGRCGYIDGKGNVAIPLRYSQVREFAEGRGGVIIGGRGSFIDRAGQVVVPAVVGRVRGTVDTGGARRFGDGLSPAACGRRWGYVDRDGRWAIKPVFTSASEIQDGIATVGLGPRQGHIAAVKRRPIDFGPDDLTAQPISLPLCGATLADDLQQDLHDQGSMPRH